MVRSAVRVVVRIRPSEKFADRNLTISPDGKSITVHLKRQEESSAGTSQQDDHIFRPDGILHNASQEAVYGAAAFETVERFLEGYNGSILAYGQTGSGKTYTMSSGDRSYSNRGIIPRAISHIFRAVRNKQQALATLRVSYFEIYNEQISDLLGNAPAADLAISENAKGHVSVKGLTTLAVTTEEDALSLLFEGETNRAIAEHQLNRSSSRSHAVFSISMDLRAGDESSSITTSKLHLVDLAGSERLSKTKSTGGIAKEATYINRSLSFLEQVTGALAEKGRDHVPYRSSKLTHVLKDCLGGNCQTVMIATVWGEAVHLKETVSTLKFAARMARVSNEVSVNVRQDPESLLKRCEAEVRELRQALLLRSGESLSSGSEGLSPGQRAAVREDVRAFLGGAAAEPPEITSTAHLREVLLQCRVMYQDALARAQPGAPLSSRSSSSSHLPSTFSDIPTAPNKPSRTPPEPSGKTGVSITRPPSNPETATAKPGASLPRPPFYLMPANIVAVGDEDCCDAGLGVGVAPEDARPRGEGEGFGVSEAEACGAERSGAGEDRSTAFETYKKGAGAALQRVLAENKGALRERKGAAKDLAAKVNECKKWIDDLRGEVEALNTNRGGSTEGGNEPLVLDEEDFRIVVELKELKKQYRALFEELQTARAEVACAQKLVERSTQDLLLGFDAWYAQETPGETPLFGAASAAARSSCADAHMCELSSAPNCPVSPQSSGSGTDSQASRSRGKSTNSTSETGTTRRKSSVSGTESNRSGRKASTSSSASDASDPDEAAFLHLQDRTAGKRRSSRVSPDRRLSFGSKVSVPARSGPLMGTNH